MKEMIVEVLRLSPIYLFLLLAIGVFLMGFVHFSKQKEGTFSRVKRYQFIVYRTKLDGEGLAFNVLMISVLLVSFIIGQISAFSVYVQFIPLWSFYILQLFLIFSAIEKGEVVAKDWVISLNMLSLTLIFSALTIFWYEIAQSQGTHLVLNLIAMLVFGVIWSMLNTMYRKHRKRSFLVD